MRRAILFAVAWQIVGAGGLVDPIWLSAQEPISDQSAAGRPGKKQGEIITRPDFSERWVNQLHVGNVAPDFTLPLLSKGATDAADDRQAVTEANVERSAAVSLKSLCAVKPAVLIFGSMTCPPFRSQLDGVDDVYEQFKDRAEFLFVYIRDAHPNSVLSVVNPNGIETLLKIPQAADLATRIDFAATCQRTTKLAMPIAIDTIDNKVGRAYAGWPNRMVVVGTDARVIFASDPLPGGTNSQRLKAWLEANLAK
jgi:hypothetical protein